VKDDDLVVGTHGRGIWILDDVTPLRQIAELTAGLASADGFLFKPQTAVRVRWNMNTDTPLPPDEPTAPNPPEGAIINYYLKSAASGPVTLEIVGADGKPVRKYSSTDEVFTPDPATITVPPYWFRPLHALPATAGMHRVTWDLHYQPIAASTGSGQGARLGGPNLPIAAIGRNTVPNPTTPWVNPGTFTVKLTVNGKTSSQPLTVKQDPRVKTPALSMQEVYTHSKAMYYAVLDLNNAAKQSEAVRQQLAQLKPKVTGAAVNALGELEGKLNALEGPPTTTTGGRGRGRATGPAAAAADEATPPDSFAGAIAGLTGVMNILQGADVKPTAVQLEAVSRARSAASRAMARWTAIKALDLVALNTRLKAAGLATITP